MKKYTVLYGQSLFNVCLQVYGTLNYIFKLIADNNLGNINAGVSPGQIIIFDLSLTQDGSVYNQNIVKGIKYISGPITTEISGALEAAGGNPLQTAGGIQILQA